MKENTSIEIMPAANGFIVRPARDRYEPSTSDDLLCFQTMAGLVEYLKGHFDHRGYQVSLDPQVDKL